MATTWGEVKEEFRDSFRDVTQSYINDEEVKRILRRVLRKIGCEEGYTFQEREYTLTLTGAAEYDLDTLIPGWKKIKTITTPASVGAIRPIELDSIDPKDFQISGDRYAFTIFSHRYLRVYSPSASPLTGTLKIMYYTGYFLLASGVAVAAPVDDNTTFLIPDHYMNVVTEGLVVHGFRKDRSNRADYTDAKEAFEDSLQSLRDTHTVIVETPRRSMGGAF